MYTLHSADTLPAAYVHAFTCPCVQAVSGLYASQQFDAATSDFSLSFAANMTLQSQPTLVYLNEKLYYPNGYVVRLVVWPRLCTRVCVCAVSQIQVCADQALHEDIEEPHLP